MAAITHCACSLLFTSDLELLCSSYRMSEMLRWQEPCPGTRKELKEGKQEGFTGMVVTGGTMKKAHTCAQRYNLELSQQKHEGKDGETQYNYCQTQMQQSL